MFWIVDEVLRLLISWYYKSLYPQIIQCSIFSFEIATIFFSLLFKLLSLDICMCDESEQSNSNGCVEKGHNFTRSLSKLFATSFWFSFTLLWLRANTLNSKLKITSPGLSDNRDKEPWQKRRKKAEKGVWRKNFSYGFQEASCIKYIINIPERTQMNVCHPSPHPLSEEKKRKVRKHFCATNAIHINGWACL